MKSLSVPSLPPWWKLSVIHPLAEGRSWSLEREAKPEDKCGSCVQREFCGTESVWIQALRLVK